MKYIDPFKLSHQVNDVLQIQPPPALPPLTYFPRILFETRHTRSFGQKLLHCHQPTNASYSAWATSLHCPQHPGFSPQERYSGVSCRIGGPWSRGMQLGPCKGQPRPLLTKNFHASHPDKPASCHRGHPRRRIASGVSSSGGGSVMSAPILTQDSNSQNVQQFSNMAATHHSESLEY